MDHTRRIFLHVESSSAYGRGILAGIAQYARIHGNWLFYTESKTLSASVRILKDWKPHGIIARATPKDGTILQNLNIPAIMVGVDITEIPKVANVNADNPKIGEMAAKHFVERGFKNLAYLGMEQFRWPKIRGQYFADTGRQYDARIFLFQGSKKTKNPGRRADINAVADWLTSLPKPVGLLACNDFRARHAIEACAIAGVKVPEEVAVLGVDNDEIVCGLATPQISSIELNTQKSGYEAAQLLEKLIDKKQVISEDTIIVQPIEIVTRQSSNILAVSDVEMVEIMRYIRSNSDRAIAVGEVVEKMAMSRRTIEQRFKKAFGRTIHQEIRRARVEHVERMLLNTNRPIAEISFDLGYPSPKHLTRYFKQEKSLTPREYRRKYSK